jgi:hypothetical protein
MLLLFRCDVRCNGRLRVRRFSNGRVATATKQKVDECDYSLIGSVKILDVDHKDFLFGGGKLNSSITESEQGNSKTYASHDLF